MIRKLRSGEYRLYSRKLDPDTHKRRNLGTSTPARRPKSTSAKCNISSDTEGKVRRRRGAGGRESYKRNLITRLVSQNQMTHMVGATDTGCGVSTSERR